MAQRQIPNTISGSSRATNAGARENYMLLSFRWVVTTSWFLFLLAGILVGTSLILSFHTDAWHWFQRSGALMVSIGAILSTRQPLGLMIENIIGGSEQQNHIQTHGTRYLDDIGELRACVCGFIFVAMGTFIWAYGDLLGCVVHWNTSCMI